jgi:hypothetical protein
VAATEPGRRHREKVTAAVAMSQWSPAAWIGKAALGLTDTEQQLLPPQWNDGRPPRPQLGAMRPDRQDREEDDGGMKPP